MLLLIMHVITTVKTEKYHSPKFQTTPSEENFPVEWLTCLFNIKHITNVSYFPYYFSHFTENGIFSKHPVIRYFISFVFGLILSLVLENSLT
jgi:hypothetical protein